MATLSQFFPAGGNIPSNAFPIELLVAGGGGGGDNGQAGAGGGRVIHIYDLFVIPGASYSVTIGGGGSTGTNGSDSDFNGQIIAPGGQGATSSTPGGSGAGQSVAYYSPGVVTGQYNLTVLNSSLTAKCYVGAETRILDLGNRGGDSIADETSTIQSVFGGGGGAGGPGRRPTANFNASTGSWLHRRHGSGGEGYRSRITGTNTFYGGGGTPYTPYATISYTANAGAASSQTLGTTNTGQAGGGYSGYNSGGSGVVIVAYSSTRGVSSTTGSPTTPTRSNYRVYQFNGSGTITFPAS